MKTNCMKTSPQSWEVEGGGEEEELGAVKKIVIQKTSLCYTLRNVCRFCPLISNHFGELGSFRDRQKRSEAWIGF